MTQRYGRLVYFCSISHKLCDLGGFCEQCKTAKDYEADKAFEAEDFMRLWGKQQ